MKKKKSSLIAYIFACVISIPLMCNLCDANKSSVSYMSGNPSLIHYRSNSKITSVLFPPSCFGDRTHIVSSKMVYK